MFFFFLTALSSPHETTETILDVTQTEFDIQTIMGKRRLPSRQAYIELVDCLSRAVVGRKVYIESRLVQPLSEWFTLTDEAFLLLCLESYADKWNQEWVAKTAIPPTAQQQQQQQQQRESLFTARSRGTKRSWSLEGLQRFNALMVDVYRDRRANGVAFDKIFQDEMIRRYGKQANTTNPALGNDEQAPPEEQVVVVYNEFNIEQLLAHAAGAEVHQEEEDDNSENHDADADADDADEGSMQVLAL